MPRFGIKSLLVGVAVLALWFASLRNFGRSYEIITAISFVIALASATAAIYNRGRRRAFWAGFFATMLIVGPPLWPTSLQLVPNLTFAARTWADAIAQATGSTWASSNAAFYSLRAVLLITLATAAGLSAVYMYDQSKQQK